MNHAQFEIVSAQVAVGLCADARPCLVIYPPKNNMVTVLPISSQGDLCTDRNIFFVLELGHPDFKATGLSKKSFIAALQEYSTPIFAVKRSYGHLTGELLAEFKKWYGL